MAPAGFLDNPYNSFQPPQLVPVEYQGWVLLAFVIFAFVAIVYGLWLVATDPSFGGGEL
jgi:hypothetical protein